jgi:GNAT superfamily N-acetyltransferase
LVTNICPLKIGDKRIEDFLQKLPNSGIWGRTYLGNWKKILTEVDKELQKSKIIPFPNMRLFYEKDGEILGICTAETRKFKNFLELWDGKSEESNHAWIEGLCAISNQETVMTSLLNHLISILRQKGIKSVQYPGPLEMGNPLTRLTIQDVSAQAYFRDIGFKILDLHYGMRLYLSNYVLPQRITALEIKLYGKGINFELSDSCFKAYFHNREIGKIKWGGETEVNMGMDVHSDFQNRGIGTVLLGKALLEMKRQKANVVRLNVHADNSPALKLYSKYQFQVCETYLYMVKKITA